MQARAADAESARQRGNHVAQVILVCAARATAQCRRVERELRLVGIETSRRAPLAETTRAEAEARPSSRQKFDALIYVREDGSTETQWLSPERKGEPHSILSPAPGESEESVALRTAEHLRGELRRGKDAEEKRDRNGDFSKLAAERPWVVQTGPAFVVDSVTEPTLAWMLETAYFPGRWGAGWFVMATMRSSPWKPVEPELTQRQWITGLSLKLLLTEADRGRLRFALSPFLGLRFMRLSGTEKNPQDRYHGWATAVSSGGQLELSYRILPWLAFGGVSGGAAHMNVVWPREKDHLKKRSEEAFDERRGRFSADGAFFASLLIAIHLE